MTIVGRTETKEIRDARLVLMAMGWEVYIAQHAGHEEGGERYQTYNLHLTRRDPVTPQGEE